MTFLSLGRGLSLSRRGRGSLSLVLTCFVVLIVFYTFDTTFAEEQPTQDSPPASNTASPKVRLIYEPTRNPSLGKVQTYLKSHKAFEEEDLRKFQAKFSSPFSLTVKIEECGVDAARAALYISKMQEIRLCLEAIAYSASVVSREVKSQDLFRQQVFWLTDFFFFHELGHALIDILQLPVLGREEDAADDFAILTLLEEKKAGPKAVLTVAQYFRLEGTQANADGEVHWWDEHAPDLARSYNMLCLAYGKDPEEYQALVGKKKRLLPKTRATRCAAEYQQKRQSWITLVQPHVKQTEITKENSKTQVGDP